jgi:uncharacterized protein with HEPN domain
VSPRDWDLRISDILGCIKEIRSFISGVTPEQFPKDRKTYLAVIRSLEVIGEAAHHVPEAVKGKFPEVPWRKLKDFRNLLIHEYHGVDNDIVWKTIQDDLFPLEPVFKKILKG